MLPLFFSRISPWKRCGLRPFDNLRTNGTRRRPYFRESLYNLKFTILRGLQPDRHAA